MRSQQLDPLDPHVRREMREAVHDERYEHPTFVRFCHWAQAIALWDYSRGKVMSWRASRGPADTTRRFWWCVITWNGSRAVIWLALALYRMHQTGSNRFAVVFLFGLANLLIVGRLIVPGRAAHPASTAPVWVRDRLT